MPQNYDPTTGQWHADPMWKRYQPVAPPPFKGPLDALQNLQMPTPPASPAKDLPTPLPAIDDLVQRGPAPEMTTMPVADEMPELTPLKQRADDIINDAKARKNAYEWGPQGGGSSQGAMQGLQAAGPQKAGGFSFGPQSAQPGLDPPSSIQMQPAEESASILKQGPGGAPIPTSPHSYNSLFNQFMQSAADVGNHNFGSSDNSPIDRYNAMAKVMGGMAQTIPQQADINDMTRLRARHESLEEEKLRQPVQLQQGLITGQKELSAQQAQEHRSLQELLGGQKLEQQRTEYAESPQQQIYKNIGSGQGDRNIHSISKSGVTYETPKSPKDVPTALYQSLTSARAELQRQGDTMHWYGGGHSPAHAAFDQAVNNIIAASNDVPQVVKNEVLAALATPPDERDPRPGIDRQVEDLWHDLTPEEDMQIRKLWQRVSTGR